MPIKPEPGRSSVTCHIRLPLQLYDAVLAVQAHIKDVTGTEVKFSNLASTLIKEGLNSRTRSKKLTRIRPKKGVQ